MSVGWISSLTIMVSISHFLLVCNCSVNILIYCAKDTNFWVGCMDLINSIISFW